MIMVMITSSSNYQHFDTNVMQDTKNAMCIACLTKLCLQPSYWTSVTVLQNIDNPIGVMYTPQNQSYQWSGQYLF